MDKIDWSDPALFFTHTWWDETSQFDPEHVWRCPDYPEREYSMRVPLAFKGCDELIDMFITYMQDNHPETKAWR